MKRMTIAIDFDLDIDDEALERARGAVIAALQERVRDGILPSDVECEAWKVSDATAHFAKIHEIAAIDTWDEGVVRKLIEGEGEAEVQAILDGLHAAPACLDDLIADQAQLESIIHDARELLGIKTEREDGLIRKMLSERRHTESPEPDVLTP